jgi:Uma2 family endonuclease
MPALRDSVDSDKLPHALGRPNKKWLATRWQEILRQYHDLFENCVERIETDRYGNIMMSPPAGDWHQGQADWITQTLQVELPGAKVRQCLAVLTAEGVKIPDVLVLLIPRSEMKEADPFDPAPEICIEVLSPSNRRAEIEEKKEAYFDAGAKEVWICDRGDRMTFYDKRGKMEYSKLCPGFPKKIDSEQSVVLGKEMQIQARDRLIVKTYNQLVKSPADRKRLEKENPELVATRDKIVERMQKKLDLEKKRDVYAKTGVEELWIVDPTTLEVRIDHLQKNAKEPGQLLRVGETIQTSLLPGLSIPVKKVFERP